VTAARPFARRVLTIPPGGHLAAPPGWPPAFVLVERGEIELVCRGGARARFVSGDMVWLTGVGLRALRNRGDEAAVLVAVARGDEFPRARPS
jgi:hypothetical protein